MHVSTKSSWICRGSSNLNFRMMSNTLFKIMLIGLGSLSIGFSCSNHDPSKQESTQENIESQELEYEPDVNYDSIWLEEFVAFRDAVYRQDLKSIKEFVDFPMEPGLIWYLAYPEGSPELINAETNDESFTEQHFDKKFKLIFSPEFTKSLLKVKSKELFVLGEFETPPFQKGNTEYRIYGTYNREARYLSLHLLSTTDVIVDDETDEHFWAESSIIYFFKLINNKLKFTGVQMAG